MRSIQAYGYGCVMAILPKPLADKVRGFSALIPDEDIYDDGTGELGREDEPHATVKYGLHTDDPEEVAAVLEGEGPATATLRGMSEFFNEKYVVLKLGVSSLDLRRMHAVISDNLKCTDTHPNYRPHVTVAYLRHRPKDPYWYRELFSNMFEGERVTFEELKFSPVKGPKVWIPLGVPMAMAARVARSVIAAPHLMVDCGAQRKTPVDLNIELYGTGELSSRYERILEHTFKTTDKHMMMRKYMQMSQVPALCPNGMVELVDRVTGKFVKDIGRA